MLAYQNRFVLSIFPVTRGFGYAVFENQYNPVLAKRFKVDSFPLQKSVKKLKALIEEFEPQTIIINTNFRKNTHADRLLGEVRRLCFNEKIPMYEYTRSQIRNTFKKYGAVNKFQISQILRSWYPQTQEYTSDEQECYNSEMYSMPIYDALAQAVVHFDLRNI